MTAILAAGAYAQEPAAAQAPATPQEAKDVFVRAYRIGPGDLLELKVFQVDELSQTVRVSEDGSITLPLLRRVVVEGLTQEGVVQKLTGLLSAKYVKNPQVTIFIKEYKNQQVAVIGAVKNPGSYELVGRKNLLQIISMAGGFSETAGNDVFILREGPDGQPQAIPIDLKDLLVNGNQKLNIPIEPNDVINVPVDKEIRVFVMGRVNKPGAVRAKLSEVAYLQKFMNNNKARGMAAELELRHDLDLLNQPSVQKLLRGAWIISPRSQYHLRYCTFVMPQLYENLYELEQAVKALDKDRAWQTLATFLSLNHIGTIVSAAMFHPEIQRLETLVWKTFTYEKERLLARSNHEPFALWRSRRGRASAGKEWSDNVLLRYQRAASKDLTELVLRQAFLEGYLKSELGKTLGDTYDIDGVIVAYSGKVLPLEIKEKSRTKQGEFGVDAGRILMLLRLCLITDSNALYLIREVDESESRNLVNWVYITLADLIMKCDRRR